MELIIDRFKASGKWYDTESVTVTNEEVEKVECWDIDQCLALFNKLSGSDYQTYRNWHYFIRLENQPPECFIFIRYLFCPTIK